MHGEVTLLIEPLPTQLTTKRLLPSMLPYMAVVVPLLIETLPAQLTLVRSLPSMLTHVYGQVALLIELLFAHLDTPIKVVIKKVGNGQQVRKNPPCICMAFRHYDDEGVLLDCPSG